MQYNHSPHKLSELRRLYDQRLQLLGSDWIGVNIHSTMFKEYLLNKLGDDWCAVQEGKEVYIAQKKTVGAALAENVKLTDDETSKIVEVDLMLRKYILKYQEPFNGSLNSKYLSDPVAKPLLTLLDVLLQ